MKEIKEKDITSTDSRGGVLEKSPSESQAENKERLVAESGNASEKEINAEKKISRKKQFFEFLKFVGFSISAGVIQILSFELLYDLIGWKEWWACHLISLTLSVVWNFTFNRKFTFKSASNVPLAMSFVILYYCAFTPASVFGGNALKGIGWNGTLVEAIMMLINFLTEFVWDKFVVFNDKFMAKVEKSLKIHKNKNDNEIAEEGQKSDEQK